jgi:hypothetical protein
VVRRPGVVRALAEATPARVGATGSTDRCGHATADQAASPRAASHRAAGVVSAGRSARGDQRGSATIVIAPRSTRVRSVRRLVGSIHCVAVNPP